MEEFPKNSHKSKEEGTEPKEVKKIISGEVVTRKPPLTRRLAQTFIGGDDAKSVWGYIVADVLVPAAKDMVSDAVQEGVRRMMFGDSGSGHSRSRGGATSTYTSYNRYSTPPAAARREDPRRELSPHARATHDFREIVLERRVDADEVIATLYEMISQYEVATVADLYELVGQKSKFTDRDWGWSELPGARAVRVRNGYLVDIPKPEYLGPQNR